MVIARLQRAITFWNGILRVTGGDLKPEKCYWYLAKFTWINGVCTLDTSTPQNVTITDDNGRQHSIKYMKPTEATKAVGVWQDLAGTNTKQKEVILADIKVAHAAMSLRPLPRHLNWIGLCQAIWTSISYVLPATTFTMKECNDIAKELYHPLLPKLGCNRNYPTCLRYCPHRLQGLG